MEADFTGHINNLYNTAFWALVQKGGMNAKDAEKELAVIILNALRTL
jgi:tRNA(His) 5'-end guanylyltransferase